MIKKYNTLSFAWGVPGIIIQFGGQILAQMAEGTGGELDPLLALSGCGVSLFGTALLIVGLGYYAKSRGRSPAWGLMGFLSCLGLIFLAFLKDLSAEVEETGGRVGLSKGTGFESMLTCPICSAENPSGVSSCSNCSHSLEGD